MLFLESKILVMIKQKRDIKVFRNYLLLYNKLELN